MANPNSEPTSSLSRAGGEERRLVTGLFADLVGFTALGDERDPEEVREVQRRYFDAVAREVERFGGTIEKYIGDAAVAVFGLPRAHDDDAERALRAALAIRDAVAAIGGLEVRIGVNTGEVVGGAADERGGYVVAGDAMNVAARLEQASEPGQILVGPVTRRLAASDFDFEPATALAVKGRSAAVDAARLVGPRERQMRVRLGTAELVGRDSELQALEANLEEVAAGRGRVVTVVGEAGIGKSRLAVELRGRAIVRGAGVAWAAARSYAAGEPYYLVGRLTRELLDGDRRPVREALLAAGVADDPAMERWSSVLSTVLGEFASAEDRLDGRPGESSTPQGRQRALADALTALVAAHASRAPLLVVLDDLHWADAASQQILDELVDAIADLPVLLVATARPGLSTAWSGKRHYRQINLDSLTGADARRLARELAGEEALTEEVTTQLLERSGGNPFFLEELVANTRAGDGASTRLPETVQEVVLARIDGLPVGSRRTLQLASVVGMEFTPDLVEVLDAPPDVASSLDVLRREDLILRRATPDGRPVFVFRHPLIHEAAYRSLLVAQRRDLHGRLARRLESTGGEELTAAVAAHYRASDEPERARPALVRAAERAERLYATSEASRFYEDAASLATDQAERARLLERAAFQAYQAGAADRSLRLYREAIAAYEAVGETVRALDARRMLGRVHWTAGHPREAEQEIGLAIEGLERLPPTPELALAYSYSSQLEMLRPRAEMAIEIANRAIDLAERLGADHVLAHALQNRGAGRYQLGDVGGLDDTRRALRLALEQDRPDDAGRAYTNLSPHGQMLSSLTPDETETLVEEGIAYVAEKLPGGIYDQALRQARVEHRLTRGQWAEAERELGQLRTRDYTGRMLESLNGLLAAYRGRGIEALDELLPTLDETDEVRDLQVLVPRYGALVQAYGAEGAFVEAAAALRRARQQIGSLRHGALIAFLVFESGDVLNAAARASAREAAASLVVELAELGSQKAGDFRMATESPDGRVRSALAGSSLRAAAEHAAALGHVAAPLLAGMAATLPDLSSAARQLDEYGRVFDAARVRLWIAELGLAELSSDVVAVFEQLGARSHLQRARSLT